MSMKNDGTQSETSDSVKSSRDDNTRAIEPLPDDDVLELLHETGSIPYEDAKDAIARNHARSCERLVTEAKVAAFRDAARLALGRAAGHEALVSADENVETNLACVQTLRELAKGYVALADGLAWKDGPK